jgi:hypothetical protein
MLTQIDEDEMAGVRGSIWEIVLLEPARYEGVSLAKSLLV